MREFREITDEEWHSIAPLFPELQLRTDGRGRPPASTRAVFNGMLWVMYSNSPWHAMPPRYPSYQTCHRRFKVWLDSGLLVEIVEALSGSIGETLDKLIGFRTGLRPSHHLTNKGARSVTMDQAT